MISLFGFSISFGVRFGCWYLSRNAPAGAHVYSLESLAVWVSPRPLGGWDWKVRSWPPRLVPSTAPLPGLLSPQLACLSRLLAGYLGARHTCPHSLEGPARFSSSVGGFVCQGDCNKSHQQAGLNSKRSLSPALELESQTQVCAGLGLLRPPSRACGQRASPPASSPGRPCEYARVPTSSSCKDPSPGGLGPTLVTSLYLAKQTLSHVQL